MENKRDFPKCPYNEGVCCYPVARKCGRCGWNPDVAKARTEAYERSERNQNDL